MSSQEDKEANKAKVEEIYPTMITFKCPKRGTVTQKVMIKKYTAQRPSNDIAIEPEVVELLRLYEESREDSED